MNKSQNNQAKNTDTTLISMRVKNIDLEQIDHFAKSNKQNRTTYMISRSLNTQSINIYDKNFMTTILKLSDAINNASSNDLSIQNEIKLLREEVHQLWQFLK